MNAKTLIKQLDETALALAREQWMKARDDETRREWRKKLDNLLDERLKLMKTRDHVEQNG